MSKARKPTKSAAQSAVATRENDILRARRQQIELNVLCYEGGRPYIDRRLFRAPNESELSWSGSASIAARGTTPDFSLSGRRDRATYINDAARIVQKIQQYLFKEPVVRDGADEARMADIGGSGVGVLDFWMLASETLTTSQWLWLGVSREAVAPTMAAISGDDAVRWTVYPPTSVPDWCVGDDGTIRWLITETERLDNEDPFTEAKTRKVRTLWRLVDGKVERTVFSRDASEGGVAQIDEEPAIIDGLDRIPFVLVGRPSKSPWWFDSVEQAQCQILNLDSLHVENLYRNVFPQLVVSENTFENLNAKLVEQLGAANGAAVVKVVKEVIRGGDVPIIESADERGITRYLTPSANDLAIIPQEIERKRRLLFDSTGLSNFNRETRQIQSAESKEFDQMDTESTLRNRSLILQAAETALVAISREVDPSFPEYSPAWPVSFDVEDIGTEMQVISMVNNLPDAVPSMRKLALKSAVSVVKSVKGSDQKLIEEANKEIDALSFDDGADYDEDDEGDEGEAGFTGRE